MKQKHADYKMAPFPKFRRFEAVMLRSLQRMPMIHFTSIASNGDECIQQKDLVCMRCFLIPRCHLVDQFPPGLIASC